jgi:hypothetical protein
MVCELVSALHGLLIGRESPGQLVVDSRCIVLYNRTSWLAL